MTVLRSASSALGVRLRRRAVAAWTTVAFVVLGMNYSIWWAIGVRHQVYWDIGGDLWGIFVASDRFLHLQFSTIYVHTGVETLPGTLIALAPAVVLCNLLHLSIGTPYTAVSTPTAWIVLGPWIMGMGSVALFATDALAERLGVSVRRRIVLAAAELVAVWNPVLLWGHAEDPLAGGLGLYALMAALDRRWARAGWLLGVAFAVQPLVILLAPVVLGLAFGRRRGGAAAAAGVGPLADRSRVLAGVAWRTALPPVAVIAAPLAAAWHVTVRTVVDQPNYPLAGHPTPWLAWAPKLGTETYSDGPGRIIAIVLAAVVGWRVARRYPERVPLLVWVLAAGFVLRTTFEAVVDGSYIWAPLALALVVASRARAGARFGLAVVLAGALTEVSYWNWKGRWSWWALVTGGLVLLLIVAWPGSRTTGEPDPAGRADQRSGQLVTPPAAGRSA